MAPYDHNFRGARHMCLNDLPIRVAIQHCSGRETNPPPPDRNTLAYATEPHHVITGFYDVIILQFKLN